MIGNPCREDGRELNTVDQGVVCQSCAFGTYYQPVEWRAAFESTPLLV
ncbi:MAG TPA: hypothetical protein VFR12_05035 [Pyrinomonadaceae bacterium]|nr:hypothetical protein [Pyrinomonadaceae bacterium]